MKAKKILFATDFSDHSEAARQLATSLARDSGALLLIVHAKEPPEKLADTGFAGYVREDDAAIKRKLDDERPSDPDVQYAQRMVTGHAADAIVQCAAQEGADMIVIGSHGRTGLTRMLLGSVAEAIVRHAKCPVLTVKQPRVQKVEA